MVKGFMAGAAAFLVLIHAGAHAGGSDTASRNVSSGALEGSAAAFELSLVGALVASDTVGTTSIQGTQASMEAIGSAVAHGAAFAIDSVVHSGEVVVVTMRASAEAGAAASVAGSDVIEFSIEVPLAAFEASLAATAIAASATAEGIALAVVAVALTVGSVNEVIGYYLALADNPEIGIATVLNDVGQNLYAAQIR